MAEQIISILSNFFLKGYFIITILSSVLTAFTYCLTPEKFVFLAKLGTLVYTIIVFFVYFLISYSIKYIHEKAKKKKQHEELENIQLEKKLHIMWNNIDECSVSEKNILKYLAENDNTVINLLQGPYGYLFYRLVMFINTTDAISDGNVRYFNIDKSKEGDIIPIGTHYTQYKLNDYYFYLLKYSQEKYGRISNFE